MKSKIKMNFSRLADSKLDQLGHSVLMSLTDNPTFPDLPKPLADLEAILEDYVNKLSLAKNRGKIDIVRKNNARAALEEILTDYSIYVISKARNNEEQLLSSGFELAKTPAPIGQLPIPENLKVKNGIASGSLDISFNAIYGANSYIFDYKEYPLEEQKHWVTETHTSSKITIYNLKPASRYAIRVAGRGSSKTLVYSAVISIIVS